MTVRYLYLEDVAELAGISVPTARKMLSESRRAHRENAVRPVHMPLPCGTVPRRFSNGLHLVTTMSPRWKRSDITKWVKNRPGRGQPGVTIAGGRRRAGVTEMTS